MADREASHRAPRGRGDGRATAPPAPSSLEDHVKVVETYVTPITRDKPYRVTRQVLDLPEEADFNPDNHRPSAEYLASLERANVTDARFYEDPREETDFVKQIDAPEEVAEFREYVSSRQFIGNILKHRQSSNVTEERLEHARVALETTHAGENVRIAMKAVDRNSLFDKITLDNRLSREQEVRNQLLPPPTLSDIERIPRANVQVLSFDEAKRLLSPDYLPPISTAERQNFVAMPCINTVLRRILPEMFVPEPLKQHYNVTEIVRHMVAAGCKFINVSRVEFYNRLGDVVDQQQYQGYVKHDHVTNTRKLTGGHEHYDVKGMKTRAVVIHFACALKPRQTQEEKQKKMAERLPGLAAQADKEDEQNSRFDPLADQWDDGVDREDEDYTGGNDVNDVERFFLYRANLVAIEAVDCIHANEALEPKPPVRANVDIDNDDDDDNYRHAHTKTLHEPADPKVVPDGFGELTIDGASVHVGKFKAASFVTNCQGSTGAMHPLCIRSIQFTVIEHSA